MAVAQGGVRDVVEEREKYNDRDDWNGKRIPLAKKNENAKKGAERRGIVRQQYEAEPVRICLTKCSQRSGSSGPEVHEALCDEPRLDSRMRRDKGESFSFFFVHEGGLAHVKVT